MFNGGLRSEITVLQWHILGSGSVQYCVFLLYRNFFVSGAKNKVLIGTCLLELRLEILGFGHRVLDVKLFFLVTYTAN